MCVEDIFIKKLMSNKGRDQEGSRSWGIVRG